MSHIANDWTPPQVKELSALEAAYRAISWTTDRVAERSGMTQKQREAKAEEYEERAASWVAQAAQYPSLLEFAGFCTTAARIMRAMD